MSKYLKICLIIIITSIVLPIVLFGTCVVTLFGSNSDLATAIFFLNCALLVIAPIAIIGSIIAIIIYSIKNRKNEELNTNEYSEDENNTEE